MIKSLSRKIYEKFYFLFFKELLVNKNGAYFLLRKENYQLRYALRTDFENIFYNLESNINKNTIFIDIGANVGIATCLLANKTKLCVSIEPCTSTFIQLVKNIQQNKFTNVIPIKALIDNKSGIETMTSIPFSGINQKKEHIKDNPYISDNEIKNQYERVLATTLDDLLVSFLEDQFSLNKQMNLVIKIDVERNELNVLKGATKLLNLNMPIVISIDSFSKENQDAIENIIAKYGFRKLKTKFEDPDLFFSNFKK